MQTVLIAVLVLFGSMLAARLTDIYLSAAERSGPLTLRDRCPSCGREREFWDEIPLLSWLLNGGRCRFCAAPVSPREPILSGAAILAWLICLQLWMPFGAAAAVAAMLHGSCLICAAGLIWVKAGERPAIPILTLLTGGCAVIAYRAVSPAEHLLGGAGAGVFALALLLLSGRGRGKRRLRRETVWHTACTGLFLGWRAAFALLPGAVITALILLLLGRRRVKSRAQGSGEAKRDDGREALYDPSLFLTGGGILALLFGRQLMSWYVRLFIR